MTGEDYLKQLRARLTGRTDPAELERLMCYYTDYFEEAGPEGADAVIRELGTPAELTGRILGERHGRYEGNTGAAAQPAAGHRRGPLGGGFRTARRHALLGQMARKPAQKQTTGRRSEPET